MVTGSVHQTVNLLIVPVYFYKERRRYLTYLFNTEGSSIRPREHNYRNIPGQQTTLVTLNSTTNSHVTGLTRITTDHRSGVVFTVV